MRPAYLSVRRSRSRPARRFGAALSLRSVRRPLFRRGGFRRRKRLFVRPSGGALARARLAASAALSLAPGLPLCGGALAPLGSPPSVSAALPLTSGSPLCGGAPARARLAAPCFGGALAPLGSPPSVSAALSLTLGSPLCGGALAPLGSPLRPDCRFGAFLRRPRPKVVKKIKKIADRYFIFS